MRHREFCDGARSKDGMNNLVLVRLRRIVEVPGLPLRVGSGGPHESAPKATNEKCVERAAAP